MVEIIHGEFENSRGSSDLAEEKGSYGKHFSKCKLRRNQAVGSEITRAIGFTRIISFRGFTS
jgi:hypothetical protein